MGSAQAAARGHVLHFDRRNSGRSIGWDHALNDGFILVFGRCLSRLFFAWGCLPVQQYTAVHDPTFPCKTQQQSPQNACYGNQPPSPLQTDRLLVSRLRRIRTPVVCLFHRPQATRHFSRYSNVVCISHLPCGLNVMPTGSLPQEAGRGEDYGLSEVPANR